MKKIFILFLLATATISNAQHFINAGNIEFEVKKNNHKMFGDGMFAEMAKEQFPQFSISYYNFNFNDNKSLYKFNRYDEKNRLPSGFSNEDDNIWYSDYTAGTFTNQKFVFDNTYLMDGALTKINWKLSPTETREIAGFNCRKATGIIFDSVYVFAFYTDEITISGGPMGINGLPGMVLGITIPRMFSSWIATKVELAVDTKKITPPLKGKKKPADELRTTVQKATKDWGSWGQQAVWSIFI